MVKWDVRHTLMMVGVTLVGATTGYIEQQDASTLLQAFQSWKAMSHMLVLIGVFDLSALATLAKQSFVVPSVNGGAQGGGQGQANKSDSPSSFPKRPASMRTGFWKTELGIAGCLALMFVSSLGTPIAIVGSVGLSALAGIGCASIWKDPVYLATQLAQYVTLFIQTAQTIWSTLAPLLGASQSSATAAFDDAVVTLQNANAVLIDAAKAVAAGKVADLASLMSAVQDAVARVMAVIAQFQKQAPASAEASGSKMVTLSNMATTIQHWGQP